MVMTQEIKRNATAEALLEVALELFSTRGYGDVTIQEIAQRTNTTYSLTYYYFKNKEELFHAAVAYSIDQAIGNYKKLTERHSSPVELIDDWFASNVTYAESLKRAVKIMFEFSEKRDGSPSVAKYVEYFYQFERSLLADCLRRGDEQGMFRCPAPETTAAFVSTHIDGIFHGALVHPGTNIEAAMSELKSVLWRLLEFKPPALQQPSQHE